MRPDDHDTRRDDRIDFPDDPRSEPDTGEVKDNAGRRNA